MRVINKGWILGILTAGSILLPVAYAQYTPGTTNRIYADGITGVDYMLYVPMSYKATNPPPLVIYFDPGGRSDYGLVNLRPSCEKAGWLLVCPNVLNNELVPYEKRVEREVIDDIWRRVRYDRARVYLSGLSGGSWRANELSRQYGGEFAGMLLFGCWIGLYDDFDVFPDRLAVARSNGDGDHPAIIDETRDLPYYTQTAVRVRDFRFTGGHEIGPPGTTDVAIAWLNEDFVSNGVSYVSASFEDAASNVILAANAAWAASNYVDAVTNAVRVLCDYPISTSVRTAEYFIVRAFGDNTTRAGLDLSHLPTNAWRESWTLLQRGFSVLTNFPSEYPLAYLEASRACCASNWLAPGYLSTELSEDEALRWHELPRTFLLAEEARQLKTNYWYGWHALAQAWAGVGNMKLAATHEARAFAAVTNDPSGWTAYIPLHSLAVYTNCAVQYQHLPQTENFDDYPLQYPVDMRGGWVNPWGQAIVQEGITHASCAALCMTGNPCVVRRNFNERTNTVVWTDYYLRAARAAATQDPPLLPDVGALYYVNSNGLLRVYDGTPGLTSWITLAHAPLPTNAWSHLAVAEDYDALTWSVWINDAPVQSGLGFANTAHVFTAVYVMALADQAGYVDTLTVSTSAPAVDANLDGLGDTWESTYGVTDPEADEDGDLFSDLEEYQRQTSPFVSNPPPASAFSAVNLLRSNPRGTAYSSIGSLLRRNSPCRHFVWEGDVVMAATNEVILQFKTVQTNFVQTSWGVTNAAAAVLPLQGIAESGSGSLTLAGPLNTTCRFQFDERSRQFAITDAGLHDADGDLLADEWEQQYFGTTTGAQPHENPDLDGYDNLGEYFNGLSPMNYDLYSRYRSVTIASTRNGWSTTSSKMSLVGDHLWKYDAIFFISDTNLEFKFVGDGTWDVNWGETNQPVSTTSFVGRAELSGNNIVLRYPLETETLILFNDQTLAYGVLPVANDGDYDGIADTWEILHFTNRYAVAPYGNADGDRYSNADEYLNGTDPHAFDGWASELAGMSVAGSFNGWNPSLLNMQLITNHLWRYEASFQQESGVEFKYAANGNWTLAWGDPDQAQASVPFYGRGDATPGSANLAVTDALQGIYWFTFHDLSGIYSLEYAPQYIEVRTATQTPIAAPFHEIALTWTSATNHRYSIWWTTDPKSPGAPAYSGIYGTPPLTSETLVSFDFWPESIFYIKLDQ